MKQIFFICILLLLSAALGFAQNEAVVKEMSGKVEILAPPQGWAPAQAGMAVHLRKLGQIEPGEQVQGREVDFAALEASKHVLVEKPLALTMSGCNRILTAQQRGRKALSVAENYRRDPMSRLTKALIDAGTIGDVWEVKWRNGASMGPLSYTKGEDAFSDAEKGAEWWHQTAPGGGALLDYCCYGACLSRWYLGEPAVAATAITES